MSFSLQLREHLEAVPEVRFALLFGSRSADRPRPDSDWDVAVFLDPALSPEERFRLRRRLAADLEALGEVDVIVLDDAPPLLAHRALSGERLVVRDATALVRYQVRTLARSNDQQHWRDIHWQARKQRLREGTFGRP